MPTAPYGSWQSPISAELVAGGGVGLDQLTVDGDDLYWLEGRPLEGGRQVLCRRTGDGPPQDLLPPPFNARTRVHEYGGGAYQVHDGTVLVANFSDQRLYRLDPGGERCPITPEPPTPAALRYADATLDPSGTWLVCVRESHHGGAVTNELVVLPAGGSAAPRVLATGRDFYASPRLDPDGRRLVWLEWDHPRMPWDGTECKLAGFDPSAGRLAGEPTLVAGGPEESVAHPSWSPDGVLHLISDSSGWWNLYRAAGGRLEALAPMDAEFAMAQWTLNQSTYAFLPDGTIACVYGRGPVWRLGLLRPGAGAVAPLDLPFTSYYPPRLRITAGGRIATFAGSAAQSAALITVDPASGEYQVVRRSHDPHLDPADLSVPRPIEFPTELGQTAHALYYAPTNPRFQAPQGELPPLLVTSHGGPTAQVVDQLNLSVQFFTSRGFAVVDVDYGGSTGYGRAYRQRLRGRWGIVDTQDCINAARHLADRGLADPKRLAIRGGSAGGYTTLCALTFHDVFAAGASYFGVADAETLARDTHKFESRYLDGLIGPYPQAAGLYRQRSPIHHTELLSCPVILLQGLQDAVVPPVQAEQMADALNAKGIPYAYLAFEGEQHGFRQASSVRRALEAELYFYGRILGFEPAGQVEPVAIHNL
ncbi:MAG TPA: S9 family peptidase [Actinomycetota bacterium]|nr:S9 family peptidase [Actinomycetota bacterium]